MKKIMFVLSAWLLLSVSSAKGSVVYGTQTFSMMTSSRQPDYSGEPGKRVKILSFDVWSRPALEGKDVWLELDTLVIEFFRYHTPAGTLEVYPTVATIDDLKEIRLENTQGEVVAVGRWETTLAPSWIAEVYPNTMNQMLFETVQPAKRFKGETLFLSVVPGNAFVTDDVIGAGLRKVVVRNSTGVSEAYEPYPQGDLFISSGATIVAPVKSDADDRDNSGGQGSGGGGGQGVEEIVVPTPQPVDITSEHLSDEKVRFVGRVFAFFLKEALPPNSFIDIVIAERHHWVFESTDPIVITNGVVCVLYPLPETFGEAIFDSFEVIPDREHFQDELVKLVKVHLYQR